jgi:hypothetical protein
VKLRIHPDAKAEVRHAALNYEGQRVGLGSRFLIEYEAAILSIERMPLSYSRVETMPKQTAIRRCKLRRFPYLVIFELSQDEIVVIALAHSSRRPNYWAQRRQV